MHELNSFYTFVVSINEKMIEIDNRCISLFDNRLVLLCVTVVYWRFSFVLDVIF